MRGAPGPQAHESSEKSRAPVASAFPGGSWRTPPARRSLGGRWSKVLNKCSCCPACLEFGIVSWFSVFSGNSGSFEPGHRSPVSSFLEAAFKSSTLRLLDLRRGLYLRDGRMRDAEAGRTENLVRALLFPGPPCFPSRLPGIRPWLLLLLPPPNLNFHLPSGSPQEPQTRRLSHGRFRPIT